MWRIPTSSLRKYGPFSFSPSSRSWEGSDGRCVFAQQCTTFLQYPMSWRTSTGQGFQRGYCGWVRERRPSSKRGTSFITPFYNAFNYVKRGAKVDEGAAIHVPALTSFAVQATECRQTSITDSNLQNAGASILRRRINIEILWVWIVPLCPVVFV